MSSPSSGTAADDSKQRARSPGALAAAAAPAGRSGLRAAAFALDRAPADVVAVELARPRDAGHFRVGALLRVGDRVAQRAHAQHAAAGGDDAVAFQARAGVEHLG